MSKAIRRKMVEELTGRLRESRNLLLFDYRGITGQEAVELRKELRRAGSRMDVLKNSVAARAFGELRLDALKTHTSHMNAVAYGPDPVALAKILLAFKEKTKKSEIRAAVVDGREMRARDVEPLSKLPGRRDLLGILLGVLKAVPQKFVSTLNEVPRKFVGTLQAYKEKMESK